MGYLDADIALGNMYEFGRGVSQDYQKAIEYYSKAVDQDYSRGYYALATLYKSGLGVEKDTPLALKYYTIAADKGHVSAMYNLAVLYDLRQRNSIGI